MLFEPLKIRDVILKNRIVVSPMCQYSSDDGFATDWHLVHLGSRAIGGAGLIFTEATAVEKRGRISPQDLGIWDNEHIPALKRVTDFIHGHGGVAGVQLAHAGRKASTARPWDTGGPLDERQGGWRPVVAPSPLPFDENYPTPTALTVEGISEVVLSFAKAAERALQAGFKVVEIHAAHGYLLHEFLSPVSNKRTDAYGGSFQNRTRILVDVARVVRRYWPESHPLFVRLSTTDWLEGESWDLAQSIELSKLLKAEGVDLIDCSSGGLAPQARMKVGPGYQTGFADQIREEAGIMTGAVGLITSAAQADTILRTGQADLVILARQFLRDPYWPLHAASELKEKTDWPVQYERAKL